MKKPKTVEKRFANAVAAFWRIRDEQVTRRQSLRQKNERSQKLSTSEKQMDGFVDVIREIVVECGLSPDSIRMDSQLALRGIYQTEKKWDLVIIENSTLIAVLELKSQIEPAFENSFNIRSGELIGSAQVIWTAYREGAFQLSQRPWLGYLTLLEDCPKSTSPIAGRQSDFSLRPEYLESSYSKRHQLLMSKLVRERLYDSACFLMSSKEGGSKGNFFEPSAELGIQQFVASLTGRINAFKNGA